MCRSARLCEVCVIARISLSVHLSRSQPQKGQSTLVYSQATPAMASPAVEHQYDDMYHPRRTTQRGHRSSQAGPDDDPLAKALIDMAKASRSGRSWGSREAMGVMIRKVKIRNYREYL
jgi:hypothetical protein